MADLMIFPDTLDEFINQYKFVDTEQVYTNGAELIPVFRIKQWGYHLEAEKEKEESMARCRNCIAWDRCNGDGYTLSGNPCPDYNPDGILFNEREDNRKVKLKIEDDLIWTEVEDDSYTPPGSIGKWIYDFGFGCYRCMNCGFATADHSFNYCPDCGLFMQV